MIKVIIVLLATSSALMRTASSSATAAKILWYKVKLIDCQTIVIAYSMLQDETNKMYGTRENISCMIHVNITPSPAIVLIVHSLPAVYSSGGS